MPNIPVGTYYLKLNQTVSNPKVYFTVFVLSDSNGQLDQNQSNDFNSTPDQNNAIDQNYGNYVCGNGLCEPSETRYNCPNDCALPRVCNENDERHYA